MVFNGIPACNASSLEDVVTPENPNSSYFWEKSFARMKDYA